MKKRLVLSLLFVVAAAAAFYLWYTRPQSFWAVTGMDRYKITGASCYTIEGHVTMGTPSHQMWSMDHLIPGQEDYEDLLALLEGNTYRASLRNLLPSSSSYTSHNITAMAAFALGDELVVVNAYYPGKVLISYPGHSRSLVFSVSPRELNETLAGLAQQRGVLDKP